MIRNHINWLMITG